MSLYGTGDGGAQRGLPSPAVPDPLDLHPDATRLDELLPGLRSGEPAAMAETYDLMAGQLLAFAHGLLADRATAEDVVQDVFLRLVRTGPRFRGNGRSLLAWLYTTARRRCIDVHRRRSRRREHLAGRDLDLANLAARPRPPADGHAPDLGPDPEVVAALAQLTELQRAAIVLRRVHGFEGDEVGELLGINREAVYALCARGERRLRALLSDRSERPKEAT